MLTCENTFWFDVILVGNKSSRDANFQDAEIVRSEEHRGLGPCAGPSGEQEQRHFGVRGEICHCISDIQKILQKNKLKSVLLKSQVVTLFLH